MANLHSEFQQESLALATSKIHRCRQLDELKKVYLSVMPQFIDGDAFAMYLFNDKQETEAVFSHQANHHFLAEYEKHRQLDPLFVGMRQHKSFIHSLDMFDKSHWLQQPLHEFLCRWGLKYSIEAPLVSNGKLMGSLNIARGGQQYFPKESIFVARFLCNEINYVYQNLVENEQTLQKAAKLENAPQTIDQLPDKARRVFELAVKGDNNMIIANKLGISVNTVRYHIKRIYQQLGVHSRAQLVQYALSNN